MDERLDALKSLLHENERWLMRRVLRYAHDLGYTQYTSTLEDAWRVSIQGLSSSLELVVGEHGWELEIPVDSDPAEDHAAAFGIQEAELHRSRGVTLPMFLGLMKYYRQAYLDLIAESNLDEPTRLLFTHVVYRFYDRVEIGFCDGWASTSKSETMHQLEERNRFMTNEKNKYLTVFDSLRVPVLLLDKDGRVDNANATAVGLFGLGSSSGAAYYSGRGRGQLFAPLAEEIATFVSSSAAEKDVESALETTEGAGQFLVSLKRMLDVSGKFEGFTVILTDISLQKQSEEALRALSLHDELTGLCNRRGFLTFAQQHVALAARLGVELNVLFMDVDNMKLINDVHGHPVGDQALREIAAVLSASLRSADVVGRMGGDEFAALLVGSEDARLTTRRIERALAQANHEKKRPYTLQLSVGHSRMTAAQERSLDQLLAEAAAQMYEAKQRRKGSQAPVADWQKDA
jgi:diguanylate cyclase